MQALFDALNAVCGKIQVISYLFWDFPTNIAGMDLSALWNLSDFANILIAYCNLPLLYIGFKYVKKATAHFEKNDGTPFTSKVAEIDVPVWDEKANQ